MTLVFPNGNFSTPASSAVPIEDERGLFLNFSPGQTAQAIGCTVDRNTDRP